MTPLNFNPQSLHFRLATTYGPMYKREQETDICTYTRAVLKGLFVVLVIILAGGLAAGGFGDAFAWIAAMIVNWSWIEPNFGAFLITAATGLISCVAFFTWAGPKAGDYIRYQIHKRQKPEDAPPSFIEHAYKSFKQKYCVPVTFGTTPANEE